jgi:hypothetical protein
VNDVYALVRSLRHNRLPRNRHFEVHATPSGQAARRLHRFLRAIERDVMAADAVSVRPRDGGVVVELEFGSLRLTRAVSLTHEELALLVEDPRLSARLGLP